MTKPTTAPAPTPPHLRRLRTDRDWLWYLEKWLACAATTPYQYELRRALYQHLCATCVHEWTDRPTNTSGTLRHCTLCDEIEWE